MGSVARSSSRRLSRSSPRIEDERGVSTKPAAIRLTRIGASSSARLAMRVDNATEAVEAIPRPARGRRSPVPVINISEPGGLTLSAASCDLEHEQRALGEAASRLLWRHFEGRPVAGRASGDHHLVDRSWEIVEERPQGRRIVGVEGRGALRVQLERRLLEAFAVAPGEDNAGALGAGSPGGFQPDAGAAADDDDGLAEQFRFALSDSSGGGSHEYLRPVVRTTRHEMRRLPPFN